MKKIFWFLAILFFIIMVGVLGGCNKGSNSEGLSDFITLDELNDFMDGGTGFILVTSEFHDDDYQAQKKPIENALKANNEAAVIFNVYMEDGKTLEDKDINPYKELFSNSLNYVKNGEVIETFRLTRYDGNDIEQAISDFVKNISK